MAGKSNETAESFCYICPCRSVEKESPFWAGPQPTVNQKIFPEATQVPPLWASLTSIHLHSPRICLSLVLGIHHPSQILLAMTYPKLQLTINNKNSHCQ